MLDRFERFSFAISELSRYWHKITADQMESYGLKGPYVVYFTTLYRYPEGLSAVKLGELCCRDKADVSRAVSVLEKKGLIMKDKTKKSQYRTPITLTEEGRRLAEDMIQKASKAVELGGKGLTEEQREVFYHSLELIGKNLQVLSEEGLPAQDMQQDDSPALSFEDCTSEEDTQMTSSTLKMILFDLDGTLLPMDQDTFIQSYFGLLAKKMAPLGYEANGFMKAIYSGVSAMVRNDGSKLNEDAFWNDFTGIYGEASKAHLPVFEEFYANEFQQVQNVCGFNPQSNKVIKTLKKMGFRLTLATNPLFPPVATQSRIRWAGLDQNDFEWITTYDNSSFCKPNPNYYKEILKKLGVKPEECLMVGNDVNEDMVAGTLGMNVFLLTYDLINKNKKDIDAYPHGDFDALMDYVKSFC